MGQTEAVDPLPFIVAQVSRQWNLLDLPGWAMTTKPATGRVLINVPTKFASDAPRTVTLAPFPVLGQDVTLTLHAIEHIWDYDDGHADAVGPGEPKIEYAHRSPGPFHVVMTTRYTATFTVAGSGAVYDTLGVANVAGPAMRLEVVETHSELIEGDR